MSRRRERAGAAYGAVYVVDRVASDAGYRARHAAREAAEDVLDRVTGRDRVVVPPRRWIRHVISDAGPPDPITRHVLLTLAAVMPDGDAGARVSHAQVARLTALGERTVRDRIAWAIRHAWLAADGPRTRRRYHPAIPVAMRRVVPDAVDAIRHDMPDGPDAIRRGVPHA